MAAPTVYKSVEDTKNVLASATASPAQAGLWTRITDKVPFLKTKKGLAITIIAIVVIIGGGLAGLAGLPKPNDKLSRSVGPGEDGSSMQNAISSDSYFFGQSPPVYPSPNTVGSGSWAQSFQSAQAMVAKMTMEEKISLTAGSNSNTGCTGFLNAIPRLHFPGMCFQDAGNGARNTDFVSSWPSGLHVAASWNRNLTLQRGQGMGGEFRTKGGNVFLGPVVGPLGRTVTSGRNWEGFSPDPYLSGALVHETVSGVQSTGVITSTKHFIGNEQESQRRPSGTAQSVSSNIDDQTMHELYLWPFADAIHAGSGNIMCSYQRINNSYGCANSATLNGLLKTELGFQGFVVSDWNAQYAGVATALSGLDVAMPGPSSLSGEAYWGPNLTLAVNNGSVSESRVNDMITRLLSSWYQLGQNEGFPSPGIGFPQFLTAPHTAVDARNASFKQTLLDGAIEGHVLVKNTNSTLPLKKPKMLSIFGYSATLAPQHNVDTWAYGAESIPDPNAIIAGFIGNLNWDYPQIASSGTLFSGGGSGASTPSLGRAPFDALIQRAYDDDTSILYDFKSEKPVVNGATDACIVMGNAFALEGADRSVLHDDYTDGLIKHVAGLCKNTIVVLHNAGTRLVDQFADNENVKAIIFAHLPGQESGPALVSLLYGESNAWGKLPYTVARNESDYGGLLKPSLGSGQFTDFPQANFTEGVFIDYRRFDQANIEPRYEFGFGLSYTTFSYSNLATSQDTTANTSQYPSGAVLEGGQTDLWDVLFSVTVDVQNTGKVNGTEVPQLYLQVPDATRPRVLRGFDKPFLEAGQTVTVTFPLTRRDLSVWDTVAQKWALQRGKYTVFVGASSRDLALNKTLII